MLRVTGCLTALIALLMSSHAFAAFDNAELASNGPLAIERIAPNGEDVPAANQIIIEFNRPVVALGKMDRSADEIPITITPSLTCQWRWISTTALACNLDEKQQMLPSTNYRIDIRPGIKTLDGVTLTEAVEHHFITERAETSGAIFRVWKSPGLPVMRVHWNQSVTKQSVLQHLYFMDADQHRIPVAITADKEKRLLPAFLSLPGEKEFVRVGEEEQTTDDKPIQVNGDEARRAWIVEPATELPPNQTITLSAEPGFIPAVGNEPSVNTGSVTDFDTFPAFSFIGVECTNDANEDVLIAPGEVQKADNFCDPLRPVSMAFSSPVSRKQIKEHVNFEPTLNGNRPDANPWGDLSEESDRVTYAHQQNRHYGVDLPFGLKPAQQYKLAVASHPYSLWERFKQKIMALFGYPVSTEVDIEDKFGRRLQGTAFNLSFTTDHRSPNVLLEYTAAVLEKNIDSDVPLYVDNLNTLSWSYNRLTAAGSSKHLKSDFPVAHVPDIQFSMPVGIRTMLDNQSGALWGTLSTDPNTLKSARTRGDSTRAGYNERADKKPLLFAEVTPYQVHIKLGHFNTLVWVTDLATGEPVTDADVTIYKDRLTELNDVKTNDGAARTDADGLAVLPGTENIDPLLAVSKGGQPTEQGRFFVRVSKGKDMALLPIWNQFQIDGYRSSGTSFYPRNEKKFGHMVTWGMTAEGIYHPGDTIQYKFYVRNQDNTELVPPPLKGYWLEIVDPTGKVVQTVKDITLSEFGSASGEFTTGKKASVGWYNFRLKGNLNNNNRGKDSRSDAANCAQQDDNDNEDNSADDSDATANACGTPSEFTWTPMRVLVSDFTPVPFEVRNQLNGDLFHPGDKVGVDTDAKLHSGGPYTQAQARITALLSPTAFTSKNPAAAGFAFGSERESTEPKQIYQVSGPLDAKGEVKNEFTVDEKTIFHGRLTVESAVQDDRGKYVAHQSSADYVGVDRLAGLRLPKWFYVEQDDIAPDYIVVDDRGTPVKDVAVSMTLSRKQTTAAKVKGAGNSYVPDAETSMVKEAECQGVSDVTSKTCHLKPEHAGEYTLKATVTDTHGRTQETQTRIWVSGKDYVMWDDDDGGNYVDIVPDKESYHIGDTAHYLIKNPYPGAKALITVERYGVIDHFVMTLQNSTPVFDLPIKAEYMPGFYLSVVITSPRVEKPSEPGQIDLGKPTFRMGYVKTPVKDAYKEIVITAKSDKDVYRPQDKVHVTLNARARYPKNEPIELAVVVVDEAVFDLIAQGRDYYDPYKGFYNLGDLDLRNYSLLTRLVGRQKFEKKGANPGGDGGSALNMRSIFKYISYWNPALKTDADGNASIDFTVPDNLTGWRVLVIANTPSDRFGLGETNFKVNRPTEIRPEMPNQIAEGDQFAARFSVMNRTDHERTLKVTFKAEGDVDNTTQPDHVEKSITLKAYERALIEMPVKVKVVKETIDTEHGSIHFVATAGDEADRDGMTHDVPVYKLRSLDVAANYGTTLAPKVVEPIAFPENIYPDVGALSVTVAPTVIGNLEGAFKYIRDYPYPCWEQVLTRGVMAAHFKALRGYISNSMQWSGSDALPDQTLTMASEYQAPNGGMAYFLATDEHVDPYLSAYTALAFNWLRHSGYTIPDGVEKKLHKYLLNFLRHDEAPDFYTAGMASTVRAVALAALAESKEVDLDDLDRYAPFVKDMSLFGQTYYAMAAMQIAGGEKHAIDTATVVLTHANETGGKFVFNEQLDDGYLRILNSPLRENCAILDLFTALGETAYGKTLASDIPFKLVRSITQSRGGRDHWENTQENMFCMNALIDYSRAYEKDKPDMQLVASLDQQEFGHTQFKDFRDPLVTFERPVAPADVGRKAEMELTREGTGRVYYATRLSYASRENKDDDTNAGIEIHREYSMEHDGKWTLLTKPYAIHQGDLVRVDLFVSLPAARNFVVVDDPIPGGLEPVNADLANNSKVDADKGAYQAAGGSLWFKYNDWSDYNFSFWSFNHKELLNNAARFYADYLPPGHYHLSYTVQAIGAGDFAIMPSMAAEMYDPDVYGKTGFDHLNVSSNLPSAP